MDLIDEPMSDSIADAEPEEVTGRKAGAKKGNGSWKLPVPATVPNEGKAPKSLGRIDSQFTVTVIPDEKETAQNLDSKIILSLEVTGKLLYQMKTTKGYEKLGYKNFTTYVQSVVERTGKSESSVWRMLRSATEEKEEPKMILPKNSNKPMRTRSVEKIERVQHTLSDRITKEQAEQMQEDRASMIEAIRSVEKNSSVPATKPEEKRVSCSIPNLALHNLLCAIDTMQDIKELMLEGVPFVRVPEEEYRAVIDAYEAYRKEQGVKAE